MGGNAVRIFVKMTEFFYGIMLIRLKAYKIILIEFSGALCRPVAAASPRLDSYVTATQLAS